MAKKTPAQLDAEIDEALNKPTVLDKYLQLANHAARWAHPRNPFAAHPSLRPYMKRVPKDRIGEPVDRQFWLGEVFDDIARDAESALSPTEMKRWESVVRLLLAKPPRS